MPCSYWSRFSWQAFDGNETKCVQKRYNAAFLIWAFSPSGLIYIRTLDGNIKERRELKTFDVFQLFSESHPAQIKISRRLQRCWELGNEFGRLMEEQKSFKWYRVIVQMKKGLQLTNASMLPELLWWTIAVCIFKNQASSLLEIQWLISPNIFFIS